jgi:hypothetical protein
MKGSKPQLNKKGCHMAASLSLWVPPNNYTIVAPKVAIHISPNPQMGKCGLVVTTLPARIIGRRSLRGDPISVSTTKAEPIHNGFRLSHSPRLVAVVDTFSECREEHWHASAHDYHEHHCHHYATT